MCEWERTVFCCNGLELRKMHDFSSWILLITKNVSLGFQFINKQIKIFK
jgi:hypothetical protein